MMLSLSKDYYGITFPAPATLTGRDGSLANNPYSGECNLKMRMVGKMCWFLNAGHPAIAEAAIIFPFCKQLNPSVQTSPNKSEHLPLNPDTDVSSWSYSVIHT